MNLRALYLRALDLFNSFGAPPYTACDAQAYKGSRHYYGLVTALAVTDPHSDTIKGGRVSRVSINGVNYHFTRDRLGRTHLPKAVRERML